MPKISAVMTSYNKARWIGESIESVVNQSFPDWELIIVDDNSSDPTVAKTIEPYLDDDRVSLYVTDIKEEERYDTARYATNINLAVREYASGDYITYITDDDYFYPQRFDAYNNFFGANSTVDVAYSAQHVVDVNGRVSGMRKAEAILEKAWDVIDHNSVMHTRKVFDEVGGWYDRPGSWGGADSYFFKKLNEAGYNFYPVSKYVALECKRYHKDSVQWKIANKCFFPEGKDPHAK